MRLLYFIKPHVMEDYLMSKYASVLELIGNTPVVRLSRLFPDHDVWLKLERANPGGSVKDRIALQWCLMRLPAVTSKKEALLSNQHQATPAWDLRW